MNSLKHSNHFNLIFFLNSAYCQPQILPILPSFLVLGKDINRMEQLFYKILVLNDSVFCIFVFFFLSEDCKTKGTAFSTKVFIPKKYCFLFAKFFMIADFERVSIVCALSLITRVLNVWFRPVIEFTYSDAIHEKIAVHAISVFQEKI